MEKQTNDLNGKQEGRARNDGMSAGPGKTDRKPRCKV
jgi:hypothetical protein